MNDKEKELVTEEFCSRKDTYNICPGGQGGFGYINKNGLVPKIDPKIRSASMKEKFKDPVFKKKILENTLQRPDVKIKAKEKYREKYPETAWKGRKHKTETILKLRKSKNKGRNNSQYGTIWITNGKDSKKIKKEQETPKGWYKGRICK